MNDNKYQKDIVVLSADKNMEYSMKGIMERSEALGIKKINSEFYRHPQKDPGCLLDGPNFLRQFVNKFHHALVVLDREGCGKDMLARETLESEIENNLKISGWGDRAAAIVIEPELENWLWSDSPEVEFVLGWQGKTPPLRRWLEDKGFLTGNSVKPSHPKEAVESALKIVNKPRSSSIFYQLAKTVSLKRCQDPAFLKLKEKLQQWFDSRSFK